MGWCAGTQLSPECMDLLNKIFVINQDQRITVPNIKAHPWYTKPLLAKYQAAEETLAQRQEQLNAYVQQRQLNSVRHGHLLLPLLGLLMLTAVEETLAQRQVQLNACVSQRPAQLRAP